MLHSGKAAQHSGGCEAKAMSDQGRTSTSGIEVAQVSEGTASKDPVTQAVSTEPGGSVLEDPTGSTEKRVAVFLNATLQPQQTEKLAAQGVTAITVQRVGAHLNRCPP